MSATDSLPWLLSGSFPGCWSEISVFYQMDSRKVHNNGNWFPSKKTKRAAQTSLVASSLNVRHHFCHACSSQLLGLSYLRRGAYTRPEHQRAVSIRVIMRAAHYSSLVIIGKIRTAWPGGNAKSQKEKSRTISTEHQG